MIADIDASVVLVDGLGFGLANVVVAVPQAWIDVRTMADLDDVATAFRLRHGRKMRVATKYVNLTRAFFAAGQHRRLPDRRKSRRDRRRARRRHRRADRRHHHDRRDARRQRAQDHRRRRHPALAGEPRGLAPCAAGASRARDRAHHSRPHRRGARARVPSAKCARAFPAATMRCWRRQRSGSASPRRSAGRPRPGW